MVYHTLYIQGEVVCIEIGLPEGTTTLRPQQFDWNTHGYTQYDRPGILMYNYISIRVRTSQNSKLPCKDLTQMGGQAPTQ